MILLRQRREELEHPFQEGLMVAKKRQNLNDQITEYHIIEVVKLLRGIFALAPIPPFHLKLSCMVVENAVD